MAPFLTSSNFLYLSDYHDTIFSKQIAAVNVCSSFLLQIECITNEGVQVLKPPDENQRGCFPTEAWGIYVIIPISTDRVDLHG